MRMTARVVNCFILLTAFLSASFAESDGPNIVVMKDGFEQLPSGPLSKVLWARAEYHYLPECAPKGPWSITAYSSATGSQRAWKVIEHAGKKALLQDYLPRSEKHTHPMVVAGDPLWRDYSLNVRFAPQIVGARSGVAFRYQNDRCYYFFGVEKDQVLLKVVRHETAFRVPDERVLAQKELIWSANQEFAATITVTGQRIQVALNDQPLFDCEDSTFAEGKIGLTSDVPTRFQSVQVSMSASEHGRLIQSIAHRQSEEAALQQKLPGLKVTRKIDLKDFGVGRNVRFGDLNHDGQIDVLVGQIEHHGPKDQYSEVSCLTAVTLDGKVLWQLGEPDPWKDHLTNDVAMQIHDLDGDGQAEVIYCKDQELIIAEGTTGKTIRKVPTPKALPNPRGTMKYPRILGDSLFFADLRGRGRADHLVIKDRYTNFWTIDANLQTFWSGNCQTGHYPFAIDTDGDGREELFVGHSLFHPDGTKVWSLDSSMKDHADALAVVDLHPEAPSEPKVLCAASDEGFYIADLRGKILKRHRIGHAQNLTVADFRKDLPGLEILIMNYWGNQGIANFFNADGERLLEFEPSNYGSPSLPLNWTGNGEEFFVLSPNVEYGGVFDGHGRRVIKFPADGHPDMCYAVLDVEGDCRDELVVWDPFELWVYSQSDSPRTDRLYRPKRNPTYNFSNYQASVSLPDWTESAPAQTRTEIVFPQADWARKSPAELGLDEQRVEAVAQALGSRGCIIKSGYIVKEWGSQSEKGDWFSSAKPVLSTLLMFAIKEGKIKSFDQPIADFGWEMSDKDRSMTFRQLANMTSGYARPEGPGQAYSYNDYAINLYQKTLFDKVFQDTPANVFHSPQRFGALQLQDGFDFRETNRRIKASVRDFARVAWLWMNHGQWNGQQLLPNSYFDENMQPQVPSDLPLSSNAPTDDYLKTGTYGGESNHFTVAGAGIYGFNWWFNRTGRTHPDRVTWPDAPADTVMSLGVRGNSTAMIPSLNLLVVAANADWGNLEPGNADSKLNRNLKLIVEAGTPAK